MSITYTYNYVKDMLNKRGYYLDIDECDYKGVTTTSLLCHDDNGYKYIVTYDSVVRGVKPRTFAKCNPFVIDNINTFLKLNNKDFTCISNSDEYKSKKSDLSFICNRCGEIIHKSWDNLLRTRNNYTCNASINCPNCDGRTESLHAIILKQVFKHYYPDTIEEERSCVNPDTGKIMPTDIVNHRLKIAVEIQSQWHDFEDIKKKDRYKKSFWIGKGYSFYDPDIRNYTPLEMCKLFFDIDELPDFINYEYKNKINVKKIQDMLNSNMGVHEIAEELDINPHRIYDAIYDRKLYYPESYKNRSCSPVDCFDIYWNFIKSFDSIKEAGKEMGVNPGLIASCLYYNKMYTFGYNWCYA